MSLLKGFYYWRYVFEFLPPSCLVSSTPSAMPSLRLLQKLSLSDDVFKNSKKSLHSVIEHQVNSLHLGDVRDLVQSLKNCRSLSIEGFAFSIYKPGAFHEELRGAFDAFSSLETVVFEMPHESWKTESIPAVLQNVMRDLDVYITYSFNAKPNGSIFVRFVMLSGRVKCATHQLLQIADSVGAAGPVVCYRSKESSLAALPPHAHLVCDGMTFLTNAVEEYQLDFFTAAVFDAALTGAKRVNQLAISMLFSGGVRPNGNDLLAQWDNISFILSKCKNCKCVSVTGAECENMGSFLGKLRAFLAGVNIPLFMYALFFEIRPPSPALSEKAVDKPLYTGTWRHKTVDGNVWEQGISRSSTGTMLVWCVKMTRKRKRSVVEFCP